MKYITFSRKPYSNQIHYIQYFFKSSPLHSVILQIKAIPVSTKSPSSNQIDIRPWSDGNPPADQLFPLQGALSGWSADLSTIALACELIFC
jgi:hypothetical protein